VPVRIRPGTDADVQTIVRLVNKAYEVEHFFVQGDRTHTTEVQTLLGQGRFLVAEDDASSAVIGCIYVESGGPRGSFGMLAVDPQWQRRGIARELIAAAEQAIQDAGGRFVDIHVVNVREDLLPRYRRLGYVDAGTAPYVHRPVIQQVHFIVMRKAL
jgi:ribosomal protein S18 acetylase RimI-like enzyme